MNITAHLDAMLLKMRRYGVDGDLVLRVASGAEVGDMALWCAANRVRLDVSPRYPTGSVSLTQMWPVNAQGRDGMETS